MNKALALAAISILACSAHSQERYTLEASCMPHPLVTPGWLASTTEVTANSACICVNWLCLADTPDADVNAPPVIRRVTYCSTWADQKNASARIDTIQKSSDPHKMLNTLGNRITMKPLAAMKECK